MRTKLIIIASLIIVILALIVLMFVRPQANVATDQYSTVDPDSGETYTVNTTRDEKVANMTKVILLGGPLIINEGVSYASYDSFVTFLNQSITKKYGSTYKMAAINKKSISCDQAVKICRFKIRLGDEKSKKYASVSINTSDPDANQFTMKEEDGTVIGQGSYNVRGNE